MFRRYLVGFWVFSGWSGLDADGCVDILFFFFVGYWETWWYADDDGTTGRT